ncbi:MAG TPA: CARDB domain-containing protein [Patescibacteria group bacterium]|nr:CARDB domain-containing protein [Patescibacteria group bacterium]
MSNIIAGNPRVLKILDLGSGTLQAARAYKASAPSGKIVLRIYTQTSYAQTADPAASATNFWTTVLRPPLNGLSASDRSLIDYLEGPNEGDSTPTWQSLSAAQWFSTFWQNLSPLIAAAGFKPCVGSIAVGNPPGTPSVMQSYISALVPALRQAQTLGGAWSYHAYTLNYDTDVNVESFYSLRYRQFYSQFTNQYPDLSSMPMILTEGGVDQSGTPSTSGWQARGTAADYERWLNWFDHQLAQDGNILGCTLFEIGNPTGWPSFDLEPIAGWMRDYLVAPTNVPAAPTGLKVVATNGAALLTWTSAPTNPTTYNVRRSQTTGGPYTTVATGVTEGVAATSYTDSTVTNGGTYYYVVTASNAFGQSSNSSQVTVTMPNLVLPDVTVTAVGWTPNPAFARNAVTFRATVKNQGTGPTPSGVVLGVGFSIDGSANVSWSGSYSTSLAPGASITLVADGGPAGASTWTASAGPHTLTATADDINRFPESNEGNNSLSVPLSIPIAPTKISSILLGTNGGFNFGFNTTPGLQYQVLYKNLPTDLPWLLFGPKLTASTNFTWINDTISNGQKFYRIEQSN